VKIRQEWINIPVIKANDGGSLKSGIVVKRGDKSERLLAERIDQVGKFSSENHGKGDISGM
jgi:hypothetical protein